MAISFLASLGRRAFFGIGAAAVLLAGFMTGATPAFGQEDEGAMARGGRLYDKFFAENKTPKPEGNHASYPAGGKYGKDTSWRCKECHGWDYKGKDGAYGSGGHATGIKGINGAAGKDPAAIAAVLRDKVHGYSEAQISAKDAKDLALFVAKGQIDLAKYVDAGSKKVKGDVKKGASYYNTLCVGCHGADGKKIATAPPLGEIAASPLDMMHKILNGQPAEAMPALRALDHQIAADVGAYLQTLPQ
jgi:cytochrome c553